MKYFKSFFLKQLSRMRDVQEGHELYFLFFRFCQIFAIINGTYGLVSLSPLLSMTDIPADPLGVAHLRTLLAAGCCLTLIACEAGLRLLDKQKAIGLYIGVALSFKCVFGWGFILGLFGFFCFLNPSAQEKFLSDAPPWVKDFLSFCKINYIEDRNLK